MASPTPPDGYQLDPVSPPVGYQLDQVPMQEDTDLPVETPLHPVLQKVLDENPGLSKNFNAENTSLVFADPERSQRGLKERGGLEFWNQGDKGPDDYPSPDSTKNVLEIYSDDLKKDPKLLKQAIYGDLMHGMSNDPYWNDLRTKFMQNFTSEETKRQQQRQTWWDDVNGSKDGPGSAAYDAYIRGWIADEGKGKQGQKESKDTMYSPKQLEILQKMKEYLKTGKTEKKKDQK
jgi:hypothetical protein